MGRAGISPGVVCRLFADISETKGSIGILLAFIGNVSPKDQFAGSQCPLRPKHDTAAQTRVSIRTQRVRTCAATI